MSERKNIASGKDPKQAYAIANAVARRIKATEEPADKPAPVAGGY